jgi:homoserine O-acetyltransferase/O-succinyltransferase
VSVASEIAVELPPYEDAGLKGAPTIVALGGISASRHVCANDVDTSSGWWESIAGPARAIDTTRWRLVSFEYLDGGRGADGRPARTITTLDQAEALAAVLDEIGVERVHAIIGASYGGMVALAFAERYPERLERLVTIGASHRAHPMTTALRVIQRRVVELGLDSGRAFDALVLARALAMTTYRTAREFAERFDGGAFAALRMTDTALRRTEEYLIHQGEKFARRFTPERFLALSLSADLHEIDPARIRTPAVFITAEGDTLVPREQVEALARALGAPSRIVHLPGITGHDAFLTEPQTLGPILIDALNSSILS